jgi:hypothetical protein
VKISAPCSHTDRECCLDVPFLTGVSQCSIKEARIVRFHLVLLLLSRASLTKPPANQNLWSSPRMFSWRLFPASRESWTPTSRSMAVYMHARLRVSLHSRHFYCIENPQSSLPACCRSPLTAFSDLSHSFSFNKIGTPEIHVRYNSYSTQVCGRYNSKRSIGLQE